MLACADEQEGADGDGAEQIQGSRDNADIPSSSNGKKRSKRWDDFDVKRDDNGKIQEATCKYYAKVLQCKTINGTSVLRNHVNSAGCQNKRDQAPNPSRY